MKKALHAKPFRLQMPGHTPRHARPEPARSKLLRGVSLCLAAVCLAAVAALAIGGHGTAEPAAAIVNENGPVIALTFDDGP